MATPEQVDKIKAIVEKLRFTYRSDSFENPVPQQHFRNLEVLALDLMEPEQAVDLTLPKVEAMNKRLGSLVDEFKELGGVFRRGAEDPHQQGHAGQVHCAHAERGLLGVWAEEWAEKRELLEALTKPFQD
ncbi:hypothetical protein P7K49_000191 [Saguinus oedipus]|uniref:Ku70/Ku80 C-terminal arm domain-containing protein n=1 Tax=Saguinus oedipus TaxID=9490 RepID=A0ABQ9WAW8_SAGOE|nr:hypothetical protein P7K49_000191 [Saguinus oedipus]